MSDGAIVIDTRLDDSGVRKGIDKLSNKMDDVGKSGARASDKVKTSFDQTFSKLQSKAKELSESMADVGESMSRNVSVPLLGVGATGMTVATQVSGAQTRIQNSLGLTKEAAAELTEIAKGIYTDGFGESIDDVILALFEVKQNMRDLDGKELKDATKNAIILADIVDADVNEVARAGSNLMSGFGITSQKAFDLMAYGAQNSVNFSKEMFDNLSEYAPLFGEMGFSAEEYFQLLQQGAGAGVYNLDYVNDAMKELQVRVKDGSKTTSDAMSEMSEETQGVWKSFLEGKSTVKDVHNAVIEELKGMDDQAKANQLGVALYGTKFEDLEADAMYALGNIDGNLRGVDGTMNEMGKTAEESLGGKWKNFSREALVALEPLGEILLNFAIAVMPYVKSAIETVSAAFQKMSPTMQMIVTGIGLLAAALGPFMVVLGMIIPPIMNVIGVLMKLAPIFKYIRIAMLALTGPVGIIIQIVIFLALMIYKYWDEIKTFTVQVFQAIGIFFKLFWEGLKALFKWYIQTYILIIKTAWNIIKTVTVAVFNGIKSFILGFWKAIKTAFTVYISLVKSVISAGWNFIKSTTSSVFNSIKSIISSIWNGIKSTVSSVVGSIKNVVSGKFNDIKSAVRSRMRDVRDTVKDLWNSAKEFLADIDLYDIGKDIISGLISGLWGKFGDLMSTARDIANSIAEKIRGALDTHSPSRVTMAIGSDTTEGMEVGLLKRRKHLAKAADEVANTARVSLEAPLQYSGMDRLARMQGPSETTNNKQVTFNVTIPVKNPRDAQLVSRQLQDLENRALRVGGAS